MTDDLFALRRQHAGGWGWIVGYGLLLLAIGVMALLRPIAASIATGLFLGMILVAGGVLGVCAGWANRGWHSRWLDVAVGMLSVLLGLVFLRYPFAGAFSVVWMIAIWAVAIGGLELLAATRLHFGRGWLVFLGVLNVLLGCVLLLAGPATDIVFLALVVGVSFIFRGVFLTLFGWNLLSALRP